MNLFYTMNASISNVDASQMFPITVAVLVFLAIFSVSRLVFKDSLSPVRTYLILAVSAVAGALVGWSLWL